MNFWIENKRVKAVLFDLDDTLFDNRFSRRKGFEALQNKFPLLNATSLDDLEKEHEQLLNADYSRVLDGQISIAETIAQRIRRLCTTHGVNLDYEEGKTAANIFTEAYMENRRAVPGCKDLLATLKSEVKLGVVTNGLVTPQVEKLRVCQLADPMDFIVISEAVGCRKPGKEIFEVALKQGGLRPWETVYVGDSWSSDVLPAVGLGMKAVWLNRNGLKCPNPAVARELSSFVAANSSLFLKW